MSKSEEKQEPFNVKQKIKLIRMQEYHCHQNTIIFFAVLFVFSRLLMGPVLEWIVFIIGVSLGMVGPTFEQSLIGISIRVRKLNARFTVAYLGLSAFFVAVYFIKG